MNALILGGAGFVGSNIARHLIERGHPVTVVDGLLPRTGARREHLAGLPVTLIDSPIEKVPNLTALVAESDLVVDAMAWTRHLLALRDPLFDCACNLTAHLHLLAQIPEGCGARFVYLGSRGQYGKAAGSVIDESTPMVPEDVQGVHKTAADHHFRVFAKLKRLNVVSLRFPNCYGPNQPFEGEDVGLIGGFIRDALAGRTIEVFGDQSRRSVLYVGDLCEVVERLGRASFTGFAAFNLAGHDVTVKALAERIVELTGRGAVRCAEPPAHVRAIDIGAATFSDLALARSLGPIQLSEFSASLARTIEYFRAST